MEIVSTTEIITRGRFNGLYSELRINNNCERLIDMYKKINNNNYYDFCDRKYTPPPGQYRQNLKICNRLRYRQAEFRSSKVPRCKSTERNNLETFVEATKMQYMSE